VVNIFTQKNWRLRIRIGSRSEPNERKHLKNADSLNFEESIAPAIDDEKDNEDAS
jgi:hypothetical protein